MEQITGLLWLILGNQAKSIYWQVTCYVLAGGHFIIGILENPITKAFIQGFKGE